MSLLIKQASISDTDLCSRIESLVDNDIIRHAQSLELHPWYRLHFPSDDGRLEVYEFFSSLLTMQGGVIVTPSSKQQSYEIDLVWYIQKYATRTEEGRYLDPPHFRE